MSDKVQKTLNLLDKMYFLIFPICYALFIVCTAMYAPKLGYGWVVENYLSRWYLELNNSLGGYLVTLFWAFLDALVVLTVFLVIKAIISSFLPKDKTFSKNYSSDKNSLNKRQNNQYKTKTYPRHVLLCNAYAEDSCCN